MANEVEGKKLKEMGRGGRDSARPKIAETFQAGGYLLASSTIFS